MKKSQSVKIRDADSADLPVLVDFLVDLDVHVSGGKKQTLSRSAKTRLKKYLRSFINDSEKHLVVAIIADDEVAGMGSISIWHSPNLWEETAQLDIKCGFVDNLWVAPEYRKRGIMTKMLASLIKFAESNHLEELVLEYSLSNKEAADTWESLGFRPTGVRASAFTASVNKKLNPER